ncbi:hypothetical protein I0C86_21715, partial [Plantactinospora sp. S1510]
MSDIWTVLTRMQTDGDFLFAVRGDPDQALAAYDLTDAERATLTQPDNQARWALVTAVARGTATTEGDFEPALLFVP